LPALVGRPTLAYDEAMGEPARKRATYQDVLDAPPHKVAEVIDGELTLHPRPASPHAQAATTLGEELGPPFKRGRGGPGGWIILDEPELHLGPEPDILVPDLGGWRRESMPEMPHAAFFTLRPDWVCEVLSPSTQRHDRRKKLPVYQRERVQHVWLIEPLARTLEVFSLDGPTYRLLATYADDERVRAEPFDAIELDLSVLWLR
jgi:Uma2 family endonuclease